MVEADARIHGTTHERPCDRFEQVEKATLRCPIAAYPFVSVELGVVSQATASSMSTRFATRAASARPS
jgi:hypothetical protein